MLTNLFKINSSFIVLMFILFISCSNKSTSESNIEVKEHVYTENGLVIEAENYVEQKGALSVQDGSYINSSNGDSWLAYDVQIPIAGRYKLELLAYSDTENTTAWIEDYIDNKDDRTYNITGSFSISKSESFKVSVKDGSPLNKGFHKIKLHLKGNNIKVDKITFTLIKKHQTTPVTMTQKTDGEEWKLVWSDEFDGEGIPDTSKWTYDIGDWGWGNNELEYYTENRIENARLENGSLIIEALKNDNGHQWTSARLTTRGKVTFLYGKIDIRAKVPVHKGNWAAGWTLGDEYIDELSWPYCGEIDILECVGYEIDNVTGDGKAHASIHCGAYYFKLGNQPTKILDVKNMNAEFHDYTIEWTPDYIKAFVDGQEYFDYNDTKTELAWPYNKAQNLILNLAIGGGWGGLKGLDETMESQKLIIDHVRVYEKS